MSITIPTQPSDKLRCPNCGGSMKIANKRIAELQAQVAELAKDRAFFRSCALSGEIPECGSEPSALEQKT